MPRPRRVSKACQTDCDLFERRISALEETIQKLTKDITDINSTKEQTETQLKQLHETISNKTQEVQSKLDIAESERTWQYKCLTNDRIEDKELLMGLEYQLDTEVPEKLNTLATEMTTRIRHTEKMIENSRSSLQQDLQQNKLKLDTVEQQLKMRNIIISGFPEVEDDGSLKQKLVSFSKEVLQFENIQVNDIESAFRCGRRTDLAKPRNLVVHFKTKKMRDNFYERRKKTPVSYNIESSIYINEDLTLHRAKLFHDARKLKKQGRLHSTWTQFGNIMVKRTIEDIPKAVYDHSDLRVLIEPNTDDQRVDSDSSDSQISEDEL